MHSCMYGMALEGCVIVLNLFYFFKRCKKKTVCSTLLELLLPMSYMCKILSVVPKIILIIRYGLNLAAAPFVVIVFCPFT